MQSSMISPDKLFRAKIKLRCFVEDGGRCLPDLIAFLRSVPELLPFLGENDGLSIFP